MLARPGKTRVANSCFRLVRKGSGTPVNWGNVIAIWTTGSRPSWRAARESSSTNSRATNRRSIPLIEAVSSRLAYSPRGRSLITSRKTFTSNAKMGRSTPECVGRAVTRAPSGTLNRVGLSSSRLRRLIWRPVVSPPFTVRTVLKPIRSQNSFAGRSEATRALIVM